MIFSKLQRLISLHATSAFMEFKISV